MGTNKSKFENLIVWQKAVEIAYKVACIVKSFSTSDSINYGTQIAKSSVSISSNIAEGAERESKKEFLHFLSISLGSAAELKTQILILRKAKIIQEEAAEELNSDITEVCKMIHALRKSIKSKLD